MTLFAEPPAAPLEKRICLLLRDGPFRAVLAALLEEWRYRLVPVPDPTALMLAEVGAAAPPGQPAVVRLAFPLEVTALWASLAPYFHQPPRSHLRLAVERPARVVCRGRREATCLSSLSEMGTRFSLHRELVRDEALELELALDSRPLRLAGKVIYVVPRGEWNGTAECEIGMLFHPVRNENRSLLRQFVVRRYLERVAQRLPPPTFHAGLAAFALSAPVRRALTAD